MDHIQGFLAPAKTAAKAAYHDMAAAMEPFLAEYGATRVVECWADAVPDGKRTDMKRAVKAEDDETVVFSWIRWPDKATCDEAGKKMMADERMKMPETMPFDPMRMIFAGFETVVEKGKGGTIGYIDGFVAAAPDSKRDAFVEHAQWVADRFIANGAGRVTDGWGVDVPDGKTTDFKRAVDAQEGETVVFGWVEWPDKATRDAGMGALMESAEMRDNPPPWNGPTAIFGGFVPILDSKL
jgi:uncharacterized protein YbaA (DUF1428 family)